MADTCTVTGTILHADGSVASGVHIKAQVESTEQDQGGQVIGDAGVTSTMIEAFTDDAGSFSIALIQGGRFLLHIPYINLRKIIAVPTVATANFRDLV